MKYLVILLCLIVAVVVWAISIYNRLVHLRNVRGNALANIDVALQKRYDLVPQLVEAVRGYAIHESQTLEAVIRARGLGMAATTERERFEAATALSKSLMQLKVLSERYPDLKANVSFMHLQRQLVEIEDNLAAVRRFFNMSTREFNDTVQQFPGNLVASRTGFEVADMWEVSAAERDAIEHRPQFSFRD